MKPTSTPGARAGRTQMPPAGSDLLDEEEGARIVTTKVNLSGPGPELMAASTLEGDSVINAANEDLGTITDIMLDVRRGRVAYAVLSCGSFLGIADKLFAIPWSALTLDADRKCFVLNVTKERLKNAPGFDKDHWPAMADERWASDVHSYYSIPPYWS